MLRPTQRGEGEMVSWKHTQPCKYSDMFAHTSQMATFFCARLFVCVCVCVSHSMIQFHPNLSEYLPLPAAQQCCGWRERERDDTRYSVGARLSSDLSTSASFPLHSLSLPTFLCSPLPFSFTPSDLPLSSCHYYCIKGGRWTR